MQSDAGVYIFLFDPPTQEGGGRLKLWQNNMLGKKMIQLKGDEKKGENAYAMHISSLFGKKYAYFFPISPNEFHI